MSETTSNRSSSLLGWVAILVFLIVIGNVAYERFTTPAIGQDDHAQELRALAEQHRQSGGEAK